MVDAAKAGLAAAENQRQIVDVRVNGHRIDAGNGIHLRVFRLHGTGISRSEQFLLAGESQVFRWHVKKSQNRIMPDEIVVRLDISRVTFVGVQVKFAHVNAVNCRPQVMQVLHGGNVASWVRHHEEDYLTSSSAGQSNIFEGAVRLSPKTRSN